MKKFWWQERKEGGRSPATRSVLFLSEINSGDRSVRSCTIKKRNYIAVTPFLLSGYQDSNLGPPAPKAGALTGLRYIPMTL